MNKTFRFYAGVLAGTLALAACAPKEPAREYETPIINTGNASDSECPRADGQPCK